MCPLSSQVLQRLTRRTLLSVGPLTNCPTRLGGQGTVSTRGCSLQSRHFQEARLPRSHYLPCSHSQPLPTTATITSMSTLFTSSTMASVQHFHSLGLSFSTYVWVAGFDWSRRGHPRYLG